ncbi:MAG: RHS repeat-associated core domain-containing protein [Sediminibacterium sp.]
MPKIAGISSKKLPDANEGSIDNKYLYNDKELFDDGDLNWYDYGFRNYDAQIGRFMQLDPLTDEYPLLTPYQYASNDPITNIDIDGLEGAPATGFTLSEVVVKNSHHLSLKQALTISSNVGMKAGLMGMSELSRRTLDGHRKSTPHQLMRESLRDPNERALRSTPSDYEETASWKLFERVIERVEQNAWKSQGGNRWRNELTGEELRKSEALLPVYPEAIVVPIPKVRFVFELLGRAGRAAKGEEYFGRVEMLQKAQQWGLLNPMG